MGHWQVVYRYTDYRRVKLIATDGAIALTYGTDTGAPVRLVDSFNSDGVMGGELPCLPACLSRRGSRARLTGWRRSRWAWHHWLHASSWASSWMASRWAWHH